MAGRLGRRLLFVGRLHDTRFETCLLEQLYGEIVSVGPTSSVWDDERLIRYVPYFDAPAKRQWMRGRN